MMLRPGRRHQRNLDQAAAAVAVAVKALPDEGHQIDMARVLATATASISQQYGATPDAVTEAMARQGLTVVDQFGPGRPLNPYRAAGEAPRTWNYPVGENIRTSTRSGRTSFDTIRAIIDSYDVAQICVRHVTNDVRSLPLMFVPADGVTDDVDTDIAKAKAFFKKPDGRHTFRGWLAMFLDDMLRFDAPTLYKRRDRAGRLIALEVVDGTTILPLVDYYGRPPTGDAPAYTQIVQGLPWVWLRSDELVYEPLNPQASSEYGLAPIEMVLLRANTDIRFQTYLLERFTAGNTPAAFMEAPQDMTSPAQLTELQEAWDAFNEGQQRRKAQVRFIPHGSKITPYREDGFDKDMAMYLMKLTCAAYGVTPNDIGITDDVNRATGEVQLEVQSRVGKKPITSHLEDLFDDILQGELGLRVQARFDEGEEKDDRLEEAKAMTEYVHMGAISPDEVRVDILGKTVEASEMVPRFVMSTAGPVPLAAIAAIAGPIDPSTGAPVAGSVDTSGPVSPFTPAEGVIVAPKPFSGEVIDTVAKAVTEGITSGSGITGVDLAGTDTAVTIDPEVARLLNRWRANARTRVAKGLPPRRFTDAPDTVAADVWHALEHATTREQVDAVFDAVKAGRPKAGAGGP